MYVHRKIELFEYDKQAISQSYADLYKKGMSLTDIAKQAGKAKSAVHANLVKAGIELRKFKNVAVAAKKSQKAKSNVQPPYGFCYFQGQIVPDQKEYENLMMIYRLWKLQTNPNRMADVLNQKKIPPRIAATWSRNSVVNILNRFEQKQITLIGGQLELG